MTKLLCLKAMLITDYFLVSGKRMFSKNANADFDEELF